MSWPTHWPTRRERFRDWRATQRDHLWRAWHPAQAAARDEARDDAWRQIAPKLTAAASASLFRPKPEIERAFLKGKLPMSGDPAWVMPVIVLPWHRRAYHRTFNAVWWLIERVPPQRHPR